MAIDNQYRFDPWRHRAKQLQEVHWTPNQDHGVARDVIQKYDQQVNLNSDEEQGKFLLDNSAHPSLLNYDPYNCHLLPQPKFIITENGIKRLTREAH